MAVGAHGMVRGWERRPSNAAHTLSVLGQLVLLVVRIQAHLPRTTRLAVAFSLGRVDMQPVENIAIERVGHHLFAVEHCSMVSTGTLTLATLTIPRVSYRW